LKVKKPRRELFLCFDLGGTKLLGAMVDRDGRVLRSRSLRIDQSQGLRGLLANFRELGAELAEDDQFKCVSVASAGPLHAERGVLLDPTNFFTGKQSWGVVPLVAQLKKIFKKPVFLENDAAAAVLAETWKGGHGRTRNVVIMTLGTGVGIGAIADGQLLRAGRGLHPEVSHIPINVTDLNYPCGCGAHGCIEAYLAGSHFARHLSNRLGRDLDGEQCRQLADQGDPQAVAAFKEYGQRLALAIRSMAVMFAPEVVVLAGGFSKGWKHFLAETENHLPELMSRYREGVDLLPRVRISKLGDHACVIGAAYNATLKMKKGPR
jgi:glucokinase